MKIKTRILFGFLSIIILMIVLTAINYRLNQDRLSHTIQLRDIESPIDLMTQEVIGYDAMLTGSVHAALLHAQKGEFQDVKFHKAEYDAVGVKLDDLLKVQAPALLEKSQRSQGIKDNVSSILKQLNTVNLELVDLELKAFDAMEENNTKLAFSYVVSAQYDSYKLELKNLYNQWASIELDVSTEIRNEIIQESNQLTFYNITFAAIILILALLLSFFISQSISRPIKKLKEDVEQITKGKLDTQLEKSNLFEIQGLTDSLNRILATMKLAILRTGLTKADLGFEEIVRAKDEAEQKYKLMYETSLDARMTLEPPNWKFTSGNFAALKMFNVKDEKEFSSLSPGDLSPKRQPDGQLSSIKAKTMIEKAMKDGSAYFEWVHKKYKGEDFPANVLLSRIKEGDKVYLQATVRDLKNDVILKKNKSK